MQIQVKCKCRASAKMSEGNHLEDVETSCFNTFQNKTFMASSFQNNFSYLNSALCQKEKSSKGAKDPKREQIIMGLAEGMFQVELSRLFLVSD